jgi:hypothetical protein
MRRGHILLILGAAALAFALGAEAFTRYRESTRGAFFRHTQMLTPMEQTEAEARVTTAIYDAAWRLGSANFVEPLLLRYLASIPETAARPRAKQLARLALISDNPEGQSAIFSQICALLSEVCDQPDGLRDLVASEAAVRQVAPGQHLPLMLLGKAHPPIPR